MSKTQKTAERAATAQKGEDKSKTSRRAGGKSTSTAVKSKQKNTEILSAEKEPVQAVDAVSTKAPAVNDAPANEAAPASAKSTKQEQVLTMLSQAGGVTIDEVMKATGWQQHSVRGFFAGTVRKKLGFELTSDKPEGEERRYAIKVAA